MMTYGQEETNKWHINNRNGVTREVSESVPEPTSYFPFTIHVDMSPVDLRRSFARWCITDMVDTVKGITCFEFEVIYEWALIELLLMKGETLHAAHGVVGQNRLWWQEYGTAEDRNLVTMGRAFYLRHHGSSNGSR